MSHGTREGMRAPASKEGRNRRKCERYALAGRREKNKARRAEKRARTLEKRAKLRELREKITATVLEDMDETISL